MSIRIEPMVAADLLPLHLMYNRLVERVPFHPRVGLAQFREELLRTTYSEKVGVFLPAGEVALVARRVDEGAERIVGLALGAMTQEQAKFAAAGTGMIRFILALPEEDAACELLIHGVLEHLHSFAPEHVRAMPYWYGPGFYNLGCGRLTGAWPWIGHALMRQGFQVLEQYGTEIRMRRRVHSNPVGTSSGGGPVGEFPRGSELRRLPAFSRAGPEFEHWYDLYIDGEKAGESHSLFAENYIRGHGKQRLDMTYLEVKEKFQGRGLGRIMLREAIATAYEAGSTEVTLTTDATNFAAMNLYRSEEFEPVDMLFEFELSKKALGTFNVSSW